MTESAEDAASTQRIARLAVEFWRLLRAYDRLREGLEGDTAGRFAAQSRFAASRLDLILGDAGLRVVTFDGQPYDPGLPVRALNADEFENDDGLVIGSTNEPTIVADGRVVLLGSVTIDRKPF